MLRNEQLSPVWPLYSIVIPSCVTLSEGMKNGRLFPIPKLLQSRFFLLPPTNGAGRKRILFRKTRHVQEVVRYSTVLWLIQGSAIICQINIRYTRTLISFHWNDFLISIPCPCRCLLNYFHLLFIAQCETERGEILMWGINFSDLFSDGIPGALDGSVSGGIAPAACTALKAQWFRELTAVHVCRRRTLCPQLSIQASLITRGKVTASLSAAVNLC